MQRSLEWKFSADVYKRPALNNLVLKFANTPDKGQKKAITLRKLRERQTVKTDGDYSVGYLATIMLVSSTTEQALFDYFTYYGQA